MKKKTVSIFGCGWLGWPLAKRLIVLDFLVKGTTTDSAKLAECEQSGIEPFHIVAESGLSGDRIDQFFQSDILVITLPFKRSFVDPEYYRRQIDSIVSSIHSSPIAFVVFTSSTSVYPSLLGVAAEDAHFCPDNNRARVLYDIEQRLLNDTKFSATVVRLAGLYGGDRKIGRFMAGKRGVPGPESPVNLIHQDDCVEIIAQIILRDVRGEIFNACSDEHPTKRGLYTEAAKRYHAAPPQFDDQTLSNTKIVSNDKMKSKLNYVFKHPDPMGDI